MTLHARIIACAILLPCAAFAQDAKKWKPYQFVGNERFEYKIILFEGEERKEGGYVLDVRKKDDAHWDVTWSIKNSVRKDAQGSEILMGDTGMGLSPGSNLMNPLFGTFLEQVDLKEGEKMNLLGVGFVKVTKKETVGGRTGFICELYTKQNDKEQLTWSSTIDPALALPIRSITFEDGRERYRMDLVSYRKD